METNQLTIITGAPGGGKSTLLRCIQALGYRTVDEPARRILAEQRRIDGDGIPSRDPRRFVDLMLSTAIGDYHGEQGSSQHVIFDRGIPDNVVYASLFGFEHQPAKEASRQYRYNGRVFFVPAWEQIYTNDEERKMSFALAKEFGDSLRETYLELGYRLVDVPCVSAEARVRFILERV